MEQEVLLENKFAGASFPPQAVQNRLGPIASRAALYLRVSTRADKRDDDTTRQRKRQEVDNQRRQLRQFCETQGWEIGRAGNERLVHEHV